MLRVKVTNDLQEVTLSARIAFSKRSWPYVLACTIPWLLCAGQRSITRLAALGDHTRSRASYYRFLSDGKWRLDVLFRCLFELIVKTFRLDELTLVLDDTLCPKWGKKIFGAATHFDHTQRPRAGYIWGHNWIVLAIVVPIGNGFIALPFWIRLYRSSGQCTASEFRTKLELAAEGLALVRSWFSGKIVVLADGAYGNRSFIDPARTHGCEIVSRLRSDARLRDPEPRRRKPGQRGRMSKYGMMLEPLAKLAGQTAKLHSIRVAIYGRKVELLVREFQAWWPPLRAVIKVVITVDPRNSKRRTYLFSTNPHAAGIDIVQRFAQRWSIEQMFSVAKNQLGLDSAEVRKERSVLRHAALCIALVTWTEVWSQAKPVLRARTFNSKLTALRESMIMESIFATSHRAVGSRRIAQSVAQLFGRATSAA